MIKYKEKFVFHQEILSFVFIVYILCLFQLVTNQDVPGEHGVNLTLFKELTRYKLGSHLFFRNVVGNIVLFIPFGFLTSYYLDLEKKRYNILITLLISIVIETIQLSIGRAFDIDDIILNIVGSFIGCLIYRLIDRIFENKSEVLKGNITIALMLLMIFGLLLVIL
jgi:glycopeptide antibiotics resistance protein